ncbi:glycosyltransferase family 39 protein [Catellatospora sp. KI3]|uniref:ArnT family glycosyltransferase n=1 Tax=Catellatospora sp. KI3 TaxID=3041620 RepID=UPI002482AC70|nr:glycosyltransferase family 39 protein [Catellatospora sp. KI3]MDI1465346.1 glycosyltransferase family 39 protein [Catellatospora sp. KI3]
MGSEWMSPGGRPRWARPLSLLLVTLAAAGYAWHLDLARLHPYYGPAVRSMASSWRCWWYGAFDPEGNLTLDKLPGAFQLQALSARLFGFHHWAVLLPQVLAAAAAVWVLYRLVSRWHSPAAGLVAAAALATTPVVAALARTQFADMALIALLLVAANAWHRAVTRGRLAPLLGCGLAVGLAFGVKMVQAWALLPVFGLLYLVAAPNPLRTRAAHLALAAVTAAAASGPWIAAVLLVPAADRPFIDGTVDNSPLSMVFGYNALHRFGDGGMGYAADGVPLGWRTLLAAPVAVEVGWLYPLALLGLAAGLAWRGRAARTDQLRAGYLLWAGWLGVYAAAFSLGSMAHKYYVIAVAPPVAALAGAGAVRLWTWRARPRLRWVLPAAAAVSTAWSWHLAADHPQDMPWLPEAVLCAGALAAVGLALAIGRPSLPRHLAGHSQVRRVAGLAVAAAAALAVFGGPAAWAVSVHDGIDPRPAEAGRHTDGVRVAGVVPPLGLADYLAERREGRRYLLAAQGSKIAGQYLLAGYSVFTMGGYSGNVPFPAPATLAELVARNRVRYVQFDPHRNLRSALARWVGSHCAPIDPAAYGGTGEPSVYDCGPTGGGRASAPPRHGSRSS